MRQIFVNLPVKDLKKSMAFYEAVGFTNNPQFTDGTAACMVLSEQIYVMLLTHAKFKSFTPKQLPDSSKTCQVMLAISSDSKMAVDDLISKAVAAGGKENRPTQDLGFMYGRSFDDLDGHHWETFWMDPHAVKPN